MTKMSEHFCVLPWTHISNEPNGKLRACCIASENIVDEDGKPLRLQTHTVAEIFHSAYMKELRAAFRRGDKPESCSICWKDEANQKRSKRMVYNDLIFNEGHQIDFQSEPDHPFDFHLQLSNVCNLKCRTCHPHASTKWYKEAQDSGITFERPDSAIVSDVSRFWQARDSWLPYVRSFECLGGEPLFMPEFKQLIDEVVDRGYAKNIDIRLSSNGTQRPEQFMEKMISNFRRIGLGLSIDGVGKRFEYLRHPGSWDDVRANIDYYSGLRDRYSSEEYTFSVTHTISWMNVYYVGEFHREFFDRWGDCNIWNNQVHYPPWFSIGILPDQIKDRVIEHLNTFDWPPNARDKIEPFLTFMRSTEHDSENMAKGIREIKRGDAYRKESYREAFPEMAELLSSWI